MSATDRATDPPLTRRERQRLATHDEIVETARELLRGGQEVSIRAVAQAMGLTPPALYRYVDSLAALRDLVTQAVLRDVVSAMEAARDRQPDDDVAAQIVAGAASFRRWALTHPREYQTVFGTPPEPGSSAQDDKAAQMLSIFDDPACGAHVVGVEEFGRFFAESFGRLWAERPFPVPSREELDSTFVALHEAADAHHRAMLEVLGDDAVAMFWVFEMAWVRLYGVVTLEVFGHIHPDLIASGAMFFAQMREVAAMVGLEEDWDRLVAIAADV